MKQLLRVFLGLLMMVGTLTLVSSCSNDDPPVHTPEGTVFTKAYGIYMSDDVSDGVGHYTLLLYSDGLKLNTTTLKFEGKGDFARLELNAPMPADPKNAAILAGTYSITSIEDVLEFTFQKGSDGKGSVIGKANGANESAEGIVGGQLKIEQQGSSYTIVLNYSTIATSEVQTAKYSGLVPMVNSGGDPIGKVEVFTKAQAIYVGEDMVDGMGAYILVLYSEGVEFDLGSWYCHGTGNFIWLALNTPMPADLRNVSIPAGTYPITDIEDVIEFTFQAGFDGLGSFTGEVNGEDESTDDIVSGELKIERQGDSYTVVLDYSTATNTEARSAKYDGTIPLLNFVGEPALPFDGVFTLAQANYYGNYYGEGSGNIELLLTDMEFDEELGDYVYPGHLMYFDVNTSLFASPDAIEFIPGTYESDGTQTFTTPFTFNEAREDGGSAWISYNSWGTQEQEGTSGVNGGEFTVTRNGTQYTISVIVELDNGETLTGEYQGTLEVGDASLLSLLTDDVTIDATKGMMIFRGDIQYYQDTSYNWVIWMATSGMNLDGEPTGTGDFMQIEINTTKTSTTEIPSGEYMVMPVIANEYLVPFSYIPGFFSNYGYLSGSWYFRDLMAQAPAVGGTLSIENKGNGIYAITYDMVDDYYYAPRPHSISGTYDGPFTYVDGSQLEEMSVKSLKSSVVNKQHEKFKIDKKNPHRRHRIVSRR